MKKHKLLLIDDKSFFVPYLRGLKRPGNWAGIDFNEKPLISEKPQNVLQRKGKAGAKIILLSLSFGGYAG
jgi:hypothetical protein